MAMGKVRWFRDHLGYGFIETEGGEADIFVHYSSIMGEGYKTLRDGEEVEFEPELDDQGRPQAKRVEQLISVASSEGFVMMPRRLAGVEMLHLGGVVKSMDADGYIILRNETGDEVFLPKEHEGEMVCVGLPVRFFAKWDPQTRHLAATRVVRDRRNTAHGIAFRSKPEPQAVDPEIATPSECPAKYADFVGKTLSGWVEHRGVCGWFVVNYTPNPRGRGSDEHIFALSDDTVASLGLFPDQPDQKVNFTGRWDGAQNRAIAENVHLVTEVAESHLDPAADVQEAIRRCGYEVTFRDEPKETPKTFQIPDEFLDLIGMPVSGHVGEFYAIINSCELFIEGGRWDQTRVMYCCTGIGAPTAHKVRFVVQWNENKGELIATDLAQVTPQQ